MKAFKTITGMEVLCLVGQTLSEMMYKEGLDAETYMLYKIQTNEITERIIELRKTQTERRGS